MQIEYTQRQYDEIEQCLLNPTDVPKEIKFAMGIIGIKYKDIKPLDIDAFEGDAEEKKIKCDFYNQQRRVL